MISDYNHKLDGQVAYIEQAVRPTDVDVVHGALQQAVELSYRVQNLISKMTGVSGASTQDPEAKIDGVLPHLRQKASLASGEMQSAFEAISRFERELP